MQETNNHHESQTPSQRKLYRALDTLGCGLFFLWIGIAFLADAGWGIGFIGIGVIVLVMLGVRYYLSGSDGGDTISTGC